MLIDEQLFDILTRQARANPRLRQTMELRNSSENLSMWMFNVLFTIL
ncbi:DUF6016 domain-containing protein [Prevotella sp. E15-22]